MPPYPPIRFTLRLTVLLLLPLITFAADRYKFGVFPHMPMSRLLEVHQPITDDLAQKLGKPIDLLTKSTFALFEHELQQESYDIAFIQPFDYPAAHDRYHYLPVARRAAYLSAIILVLKESPFKSLADLKGLRLSNPAETAAVTQMTNRLLKKSGFDPQHDFQRSYLTNHFACMQSVIVGSSDACGTAHRAMLQFNDVKLSHRFRTLAESEIIPPALFIVHSRVPEAERKILHDTITNWENTPEGRKILASGYIQPFMTATDNEYDQLR